MLAVLLGACGAAPVARPAAVVPVEPAIVEAPTVHLEPSCSDRVVAALASSDHDSARDALADLVATEPACAVARRELAALLLVVPADASAALEHLEVALVLDPESVRARELLVVAYLETGAVGAASESAAALATLHPGIGTTHLLLGLVARARGELGSARVHFETAVGLSPELFDAQIALADVAIEARDPEAGPGGARRRRRAQV